MRVQHSICMHISFENEKIDRNICEHVDVINQQSRTHCCFVRVFCCSFGQYRLRMRRSHFRLQANFLEMERSSDDIWSSGFCLVQNPFLGTRKWTQHSMCWLPATGVHRHLMTKRACAKLSDGEDWSTLFLSIRFKCVVSPAIKWRNRSTGMAKLFRSFCCCCQWPLWVEHFATAIKATTSI